MFKEGVLRLFAMAQDLFEGEKVLAFDLETTGVSTNNDRIVQYALIGTLADGTSVNVEQLVKPGVRIPFDASNVHGIYDDDVRDKPRLSEVADELAELIDGAVLVGHNVRSFDFAMLKTEFLRMGRLAPQPKAIMDTLELVRRLRLPRPHNLGALCQRHGIRLEAAHTAGADAAATMLLFWRLSVEHAGAFRRSLTELERTMPRSWVADWRIWSPWMRWGKFDKMVMSLSWPLVDTVDDIYEKFTPATRPTSGGCFRPRAWIARKPKNVSRNIFAHEEGRT